MKFYSYLVLIGLFTLIGCKSQSFNAMTYNIRLDIASDGENAWVHRKDFLISQVLFYNPGILGVQEARPNQMSDLQAGLKAFKFIGIGRDGGDTGEYSAIFYNSERFRVEKENTFWLSETPGQVSKGWDAAYPRISTYGLFTDIKSGKKFWVFNTHLDHIGVQARLNGIKSILQKISIVNSKGYPVILMGDFNVEPNSLLIENLSKEMLNTETAAELKFGPQGTFNDFKFSSPVTRKIDYIFISKSSGIRVNKQAVLSDSDQLKYPSDHFPVFVELKLN